MHELKRNERLTIWVCWADNHAGNHKQRKAKLEDWFKSKKKQNSYVKSEIGWTVQTIHPVLLRLKMVGCAIRLLNTCSRCIHSMLHKRSRDA
jgi:hypothetical protein